MLVSELIEKLKEFPHDRVVLVDGYEDGFDPVGAIRTALVYDTGSVEYWSGKFDEDRGGNKEGCFHAVIIPR